MRRWAARLLGRDRWVETALSTLGILGGAATIGDLYTRFTEWLALSPMDRLRWYLWATILTTWFILPLCLVLYRAVHRDLARAEGDVAVRERAIRIQHQMAEAVRVAAKRGPTFDFEKGLHLVGSETAELLKQRLGGSKYCVTIKQADLRTNKLETIFRDSLQSPQRAHWNSINVSESVVYEAFREETVRDRKHVFVRDTDGLLSSENKYRERARDCGYRSVLAFPLREPVLMPIRDGRNPRVIKCANLIGFFSIDSPEPNAFTGLFNPPKKGAPPREDDEGLDARPDIEFFYGLADAMATILVLQRGRAIAGGGSG